MDPAAILPLHVFEQILSFASNREVTKKFVLVNKLWYKLITSSCSLERSVLAIRSDWISDDQEMAAVVECSRNRNFHSVLFSDCTELYEQILEIVSTPRCSITSVSVFDMKFVSFGAFAKFIKSIEKTVRNLTLQRIQIENCDGDFEVLSMASLRELKLSHCSPQIYLAVMQNAPKLTSLEFGAGIAFDDKMIAVIKDLHLLKKLSINNELLCFLVSADKDFSQAKFHLEDLAMTFSDFQIPSETLMGIEKFIEAQTSLQKIYFSEWLSFDILKCTLRLKKLKELVLFSLPTYSWSIVDLPKSSSIETLDVRTFHYDDNCSDLKVLLAAVPNTKHLKLRSINEEIAQFIEDKLKEVTTISLIHPSLTGNLPHVSFN